MRPAHFVLCILSLFATKAYTAESATPLGHSTVNLIIVAPLANANRMGGGLDGQQVPMARVGDIVIPIEQIKPISILIDKEFVGHALVGIQNITPTFVLEKGTYEFTFMCDGYIPVTQKLKVVGTGSRLHLLVRMQRKQSQGGVGDESRQPSEPVTLDSGVNR